MALRCVMYMLAAVVPFAATTLAMTVIRCVALYDVYTSLDPRNSVLYTILSIAFRVTEPFFLFFNRKRDDGMPPRRDPQPEVVWETPSAGPESPWSDN